MILRRDGISRCPGPGLEELSTSGIDQRFDLWTKLLEQTQLCVAKPPQ